MEQYRESQDRLMYIWTIDFGQRGKGNLEGKCVIFSTNGAWTIGYLLQNN